MVWWHGGIASTVDDCFICVRIFLFSIRCFKTGNKQKSERNMLCVAIPCNHADALVLVVLLVLCFVCCEVCVVLCLVNVYGCCLILLLSSAYLKSANLILSSGFVSTSAICSCVGIHTISIRFAFT